MCKGALWNVWHSVRHILLIYEKDVRYIEIYGDMLCLD